MAPDGTVWLLVNDAVARFDGTHFIHFAQRDGLPDGPIRSVHAAPDGNVWFGISAPTRGRGSVVRYDGRSFTHFGAADGFTASLCYAIQTGPDGALWFGTDEGVFRYEPATLRNFAAADGLPSELVVRGLHAATNGLLWAVSGDSALVRFDGRRFTSFSHPLQPSRLDMADVVDGPDGLLWVNTAEGVVRFDGTKFHAPLTNFGGGNGLVDRLARAPNGSVWVGLTSVPHRYVRFDGRTPVPALFVTNEFGTRPASRLNHYCSPQGTLWLSTAAGVAAFDGAAWRQFTITNGLPDPRVECMGSGPDGSVWFGTLGGGLARFDGRTMTPVPRGRERLVPSATTEIFRDSRGVLWFATPTGVTRHDGVAWVSLDESDGLGCGDVMAFAEDTAGAVWIGGFKGLACYQPTRLTNPPPTIAVQADELFTDLNALPKITAGRLVTFKCNAVDFRTRPEKRLYRYAVVAGYGEAVPAKADAAWNPPTRSAQFEWIAPAAGEFTVFVQGIDRDLNYSLPARAHLTIVPPWYLNVYIVAPSGVALAGLLGVTTFSTVRYRRKRREAEQLRERLLVEEQKARHAAEEAEGGRGDRQPGQERVSWPT